MADRKHNAMQVQRLILFTDFDGTTAVNDVGDLFFQTFAGRDVWERAVNDYRSGLITSREYLERMCEATRFDPERFEHIMREQRVDPFFPECVAYCRKRGYPVIVLSDGLDVYIRRVLEQSGLVDVEFHSNKMIRVDTVRIRPEMPYWEGSCGDCANCKGYHIRRLRQPGDFAIFVGDGISDRCAVKEADLVLAKGVLRDWCREHGYTYQPVDNFRDVLEYIQRLERRFQLIAGSEPCHRSGGC